MAGIAGWIDYNKNIAEEKQTIAAMSYALKHRGPDAENFFYDNSAALISNRLIIIDAKGGTQPMSIDFKGEVYTLVYNGQLYNTEDIRKELVLKGYSFNGYSDTEVLLKSYIEWGAACLDKLNGMFAFAVWQSKAKQLFAARDRIGVKPLFFYRYDGGLLFASEIKALMKNPLVQPYIDSEGLNQILLLGPAKSCGCGCIMGVNELKPGEYLTFDKHCLKTKRYFYLKAQPHTDTLKQTIEKTRELIFDSVTKQLVSDKPVACFLSGGLDSSIISYITAKHFKTANKVLDTYSVDYEDNDKYFEKNNFQPDADNKYISLMSDFIGSNHTNVVLDNQEVADTLTLSTSARDLPGMADIDSSLLLFSRAAKKRHAVCLSGECADEIFGGYPWYHNHDILFADSFPWSNALSIRTNLFNKEFLKGDSEQFVKNHYQQTIDDTDYLDTDDRLSRRMREMFMLNFYWFMQTLLDRKDRMTMHSGLEVRVPFCDHRLVEYAYNMPWDMKSLNNREKGIVREAFKDILPNEIVYRKKSPYPKTYNPLFLNYVKTKSANLVNGKGILSELVNKNFFNQLINGNVHLENPWYGQLMRLPQIFAYLIQIDTFFENFKLKIK